MTDTINPEFIYCWSNVSDHRHPEPKANGGSEGCRVGNSLSLFIRMSSQVCLSVSPDTTPQFSFRLERQSKLLLVIQRVQQNTVTAEQKRINAEIDSNNLERCIKIPSLSETRLMDMLILLKTLSKMLSATADVTNPPINTIKQVTINPKPFRFEYRE